MKTQILNKNFSSLEALIYTSKNAHRLVFLQHGIHSKKENVMTLLGVSLVKLGYQVVAIDAFKHGTRLSEPFLSKNDDLCELATMKVVKQTALDIVTIYQDHFAKDYKQFDIIGISMGGLIAHYLTTITDHIDTLVALISSPSFMEAAEHMFPKDRQKLYPKETAQAKKLIIAMDPSTKSHTMQFKRMIMLNGLHDQVIPYTQSEAFQRANPSLNILFNTFDSEHKIIPEMHETMLNFLRK